MKLKKLLLLLLLVMVVSLFAFPTTMYAADPIESPQLTATCSENPSETRCWVVTNPNNISIEVHHWTIRNKVQYKQGWLTIPANSSVTICFPVDDIGGEIEEVFIGWNDQGIQGGTDSHSFRNTIDDSCPSPEPVRTMPMTVWQVWINEDNDFQFIFWYLYADNNWVRIYDMEDNPVFEEDLSDPNLIVDLPDGFYMVRTFYYDTMLQEFLIGKP